MLLRMSLLLGAAVVGHDAALVGDDELPSKWPNAACSPNAAATAGESEP